MRIEDTHRTYHDVCPRRSTRLNRGICSLPIQALDVSTDDVGLKVQIVRKST
jgi:hypothetical protein